MTTDNIQILAEIRQQISDIDALMKDLTKQRESLVKQAESVSEEIFWTDKEDRLHEGDGLLMTEVARNLLLSSGWPIHTIHHVYHYIHARLDDDDFVVVGENSKSDADKRGAVAVAILPLTVVREMRSAWLERHKE